MPDSSHTPESRPPVEEAPTGNGVDEWVAQSGERRQGHRGLTDPARRAFDNLRPGWRLAIVAVAGRNGAVSGETQGVRIAIGILSLAVLALGLNVVVGWVGLLDLGFVAFFLFLCHRPWWSSKTPTWRCRSPTSGTCWPRDGSCCRTMPPPWPNTKNSKKQTLGADRSTQ